MCARQEARGDRVHHGPEAPRVETAAAAHPVDVQGSPAGYLRRRRRSLFAKVSEHVEVVGIAGPDERSPYLRSDRDDPVVRAKGRQISERRAEHPLAGGIAVGIAAWVAPVVARGDSVEDIEDD